MGKRRACVLLLLLAFSIVLGGCGPVTIGVLQPRPTVAVEASDGKLALDVSAVSDEQRPENSRLHLTHFRESLTNGFKSLAEDQYTADAKSADLVLKLTEANVEQALIGNIGGYIAIRYRGAWLAGDGTKLASVAGVAEPRNPTESNGQRHIEDVVEVLLEQCVGGLEKVRGVKTRDAEEPPAEPQAKP
jgi:hypothetical protein